MLDADGGAAAVQAAADVEQAAQVAADDAVGAGRFDRGQLAIEHAARDRGVLHGEEAAESTALLLLADGRLRHAVDAVQERQRLVTHAEAA